MPLGQKAKRLAPSEIQARGITPESFVLVSRPTRNVLLTASEYNVRPGARCSEPACGHRRYPDSLESRRLIWPNPPAVAKLLRITAGSGYRPESSMSVSRGFSYACDGGRIQPLCSQPCNDSICALPSALFSGACGYHSHEQPPDPPSSWLLSTCGLALGEMRLFDPVRIMWFQSIPFARSI
jgi:hypothetical protein